MIITFRVTAAQLAGMHKYVHLSTPADSPRKRASIISKFLQLAFYNLQIPIPSEEESIAYLSALGIDVPLHGRGSKMDVAELGKEISQDKLLMELESEFSRIEVEEVNDKGEDNESRNPIQREE